MRCPWICKCAINVCIQCPYRELQTTPTRQRRSTHAVRKYNELCKERAKYRDGRGWERAMRSKLDANARREAKIEEQSQYRRLGQAA